MRDTREVVQSYSSHARQQNVRCNMNVRADYHLFARANYAIGVNPDIASETNSFHTDQYCGRVNKDIVAYSGETKFDELCARQKARVSQARSPRSAPMTEACTMPAISSASSPLE